MAKNWKKVFPTSLNDALRLCKDYAKDKHNLSVERIADEMGISADLLYKYLSFGSMPANKIRVYQLVCRCKFVTNYLAHSEGNLVVKIPDGGNVDDGQMMALNHSFHQAMTDLSAFYKGEKTAEEALAALTEHMTAAAWHRENVQRHQHPELNFEADE